MVHFQKKEAVYQLHFIPELRIHSCGVRMISCEMALSLEVMLVSVSHILISDRIFVLFTNVGNLQCSFRLREL